MKTIRQWLEELPEPYRSEALENAEKQNVIDSFSDSIEDAVDDINWDETPQGYDYWYTLWTTL